MNTVIHANELFVSSVNFIKFTIVLYIRPSGVNPTPRACAVTRSLITLISGSNGRGWPCYSLFPPDGSPRHTRSH